MHPNLKNRVTLQRLIFIGLLASFIHTSPVMADNFALIGVGGATCAQYGKLYEGDPELADNIVLGWSKGFMSAYNLILLKNTSEAVDLNISDDIHMMWIRTYCARNPLEFVMQAVRVTYINFALEQNVDISSIGE